MPVYDAGYNVKGLPFYTMKLLKGQTLAKLISKLKTNQSKTSVSSMLEILIKICDALACAHGQGIVHRDIKHDNIMIGDFGEVLCARLGLSKDPTKKATKH